jgi:enamine deaminase RidA (YjgF/YER057c/UK114 family)
MQTGRMSDRRIVNPWTWQDRAGFVQAHEVAHPARLLFCAGVVSVDDSGTPLHEGDMRAQALRALDNLETILREAGYSLADVVRLNTYVVDLDAYAQARPPLQERLAAAGCRYAATLLEVSRLARPELLVELEATAALSAPA